MKKSAAFRLFRSLALAVCPLLCAASPLLATPTIFHFSESAGPGENISLQGDSFGTGASVGFHRVLTIDTSLTPDTPLLTPLYNSSQAITVQLPKNMPMGLYAVWVKDAGGNLSSPVFINRARATGFEYSEVPGKYAFRIFGRNLYLPGATPTVTFTDGTNSFTASRYTTTNIQTTYMDDSNVLRIQAPPANTSTNQTPNGIVPGVAYSVIVSNGYGHNSSANFDVSTCPQTIMARDSSAGDVFSLGVPWGADYAPLYSGTNIIDVTAAPYNADKNGVANSINAIQQALYDAGNPALHPGGGTVHFPAGTYLIDHSTEATTFTGTTGKTITQPTYTELVLPSNVVMMGDSVTGTNGLPTPASTISDSTAPMPYPDRAIINPTTSPTLCGMINLGYKQTCTVTSTTGGPPLIDVAGTKACYSNLKLSFAYDQPPNATGGSFNAANDASHDVIVQNVIMDHGGFAVQTGSGGSNIVVRNCSFSHHGNFKRTRMLMGGITNLVFEGNSCERDSAWPGPHAVDNAYEQGQVECDGSSYATFLNNTFYADNPPLDSNDGSGETINSQGEPFPGTDTGAVTTTNTPNTTLVDSTKSWPTNILAGQTVTITAGTGKNETATVLSNTATTLTLTSPWVTPPDTSSQYSVTVDSYDFGTIINPTPPGTPSANLQGASANPTGVAYWPTVGNGLKNQIVAIISGTGAGQWRTIAANNTHNSLTVTQNWDVNPQGDSRYSITGAMADHYLIKDNIFQDQPRGIVLYTGSHDCTVVGNTLENTGMTIYLRSDQRNTLSVVNVSNTTWYGRMNLTWDNQVLDNSTLDTQGATWCSMIGVAPYQDLTYLYPFYGTLVMNTDFRRNVLFSDWPNETDQSSLKEGYSALAYAKQFTSSDQPPVVDTILEDNEDINTNSASTTSNTNSAIYLNMDSNLTAIHNQLNSSHLVVPYTDHYPVQSTGSSVGTTYSVDPLVLQASFNDSGTSTGGATDIFDTGASGTLSAASGADSCAIISTTQFDPTTGSGKYIECTIGSGSGTPGHVVVTPTNARTSWGRIFDVRSGQWLVNGAFDFFWRPNQAVTTGNAMRPIDINNGTNGLRFVFNNSGGGLTFQVITTTGGGGVNLTSSAQTFTPGNIYHIGVTFATDPPSGVTTEKMFLVNQCASIDTTSTANLIGTTTFTLSPTKVTNTTGILDNGPWNFGDAYGNGALNVNDYDCFRMYSQDPKSFSGL